MNIHAIDHVQLAMLAGQEKTARAFYVELLGFKEVPKPDSLSGRGGAWFESGQAKLHLGVETDFHPAKKAHPALLVEDLPALLSHLEAHGVVITRDVPLEGYDRAHVTDPFGNRIELMEKVQP